MRKLFRSPTGLTWRDPLDSYGYSWWQWVALALVAALTVIAVMGLS